MIYLKSLEYHKPVNFKLISIPRNKITQYWKSHWMNLWPHVPDTTNLFKDSVSTEGPRLVPSHFGWINA